MYACHTHMRSTVLVFKLGEGRGLKFGVRPLAAYQTISGILSTTTREKKRLGEGGDCGPS